MKSFVQKLLLAASCAFTLIAAPAQAAVIVGTFDPAYGGGFTNMGWRGNITLSVPDTCLGSDGVFNTVQCPGMATVSSQVQLYQLDNTTLFTSLDYTGNPGLSQIQVTGGQVTAFSTFGCFECGTYQQPSSGMAFAAGYDLFSYGLSFDLTAPLVQLYASIYAEDVAAGSDAEKILFQDADPDTAGFQKGALYGNCTTQFGDGGVYYECTSTGEATLSITTTPGNPVPEPSMPALLLGTLGLLGWVQRRRAQQR